MLRKAREGDREKLVEMFTDPEVGQRLGGTRPHKGVERSLGSVGMANTFWAHDTHPALDVAALSSFRA
ncbi:hypothetical protein AB0B45_46280 [Nonomuraea sp. NPDC049152]|uniref:hypothetical protein n=1 Tax=Nonomuraea sp. NPDC049152 TaxID=3154350 RepID=UPI00340D7741